MRNSRLNSARRRHQIQSLLEGMSDPISSPSERHEKLCRLLFVELRLNRVNASVPRFTCVGSSKALYENPLLLAATDETQDCRVVYSRLNSDFLSFDVEREVC